MYNKVEKFKVFYSSRSDAYKRPYIREIVESGVAGCFDDEMVDVGYQREAWGRFAIVEKLPDNRVIILDDIHDRLSDAVQEFNRIDQTCYPYYYIALVECGDYYNIRRDDREFVESKVEYVLTLLKQFDDSGTLRDLN